MRLFITGPTGSGKTTLASRIARDAGIPIYSLDDLHWIRDPAGDRRRLPEERLALLMPQVRQEAWVIEGVQFKWADPALQRATAIVVLDLPRWHNAVRIVRRFLRRRRLSRRDPRASWTALREELSWSADYHGRERRLLFDKLTSHADRLSIVRGQRTLRSAIARLKQGPRPRAG